MIKPCIICGHDAHMEAYFNSTRGTYLMRVNCSNPKCESHLHNNGQRFVKNV